MENSCFTINFKKINKSQKLKKKRTGQGAIPGAVFPVWSKVIDQDRMISTIKLEGNRMSIMTTKCFMAKSQIRTCLHDKMLDFLYLRLLSKLQT